MCLPIFNSAFDAQYQRFIENNFAPVPGNPGNVTARHFHASRKQSKSRAQSRMAGRFCKNVISSGNGEGTRGFTRAFHERNSPGF
jgi:hypothetical protein